MIGKGDGDPQNAGGAILRRLPFLDECERKEEHARNREEERRIRNLETADLDSQVLPKNQPRRPDHDGRPMIDR